MSSHMIGRNRRLVPAHLVPALFALSPWIAAPDTAHAQAAPAAPKVVTPAVAGEPVVLRTKWTAGQQLAYDIRLDGTMSVLTSPNAKSPFAQLAGLPLDADMKMTGQTLLDTLSVDEMGVGTVAMSIPALNFNAETFGQKLNLKVENGRSSLTLNNQRLGNGGGPDILGQALTAPPYALQISDRGRIQNAVPIKSKADAAKADEAPKAPVDAATAFNPASMFQSMLLRAVPTLWPATAVKVGETWTAAITWPAPEKKTVADDAAAGDKELKPIDIGKFDFTLRGAEQVAGRKLLRIAMKGEFAIDEKKAEALQDSARTLQNGGATPTEAKAPVAGDAPPEEDVAAAAAKARARRKGGQWAQKLKSSSQTVDGDLWFDAAAGQIVRAELSLETELVTRDVPVEAEGEDKAPAAPAGKAADSQMSFSGTMQLQLKKVTVVAPRAALAPNDH